MLPEKRTLTQNLFQLIMNAIIAEMLRCLGYDVPFIIEEYYFCAKCLSLTAMVLAAFIDSILVFLKTLVH